MLNNQHAPKLQRLQSQEGIIEYSAIPFWILYPSVASTADLLNYYCFCRKTVATSKYHANLKFGINT